MAKQSGKRCLSRNLVRISCHNLPRIISALVMVYLVLNATAPDSMSLPKPTQVNRRPSERVCVTYFCKSIYLRSFLSVCSLLESWYQFLDNKAVVLHLCSFVLIKVIYMRQMRIITVSTYSSFYYWHY